MAGILEYSTTAASNTSINFIGIAGTNAISNVDNVIRQMAADSASAITRHVTKALGSYTPVKTDHNQLWRATGAVTLNLTAAATLTDGWALWVKADGGAITVDPSGAETINGAATLVVADGSSAFIVCTGTAFYAIVMLSTVASIGAASTSAAGISELSTDAEAIAKTDTARVLTPSNLAALASSLTFAGFIEAATAAEYRANTAGVIALTPAQVWTSAAEVTLTDAATIAVDLSTFINAVVTLGGNRAMGNPTNEKVGQSGVIRIVQDGTGTRTLSYGTDWEFAGGTAPVLTTTAAAQDLLFYHVIAADRVFASLVKAVA